jgi:parvulin-like peptidyl-prolyl isomerase
MDKRRFFFAALMIGLSLFLIGCGKKADTTPALAKVGDVTISRRQYEQRFKELAMLTPIDNFPMREALLQTMIDEQVLLIEAGRRGLRETQEFKRRAEAIRLDAVLQAYRESLVDTAAVQEEEIKQAFILANEQAAARHLFAPTLEQAGALYEKLQAGATFEELAPTVFKDYRLASSGGYLGYFKWADMDPTFAAVAQTLKKGEISKPVRTKFGYSIVKLEDRVRPPILTETDYAKERKKLRWVTAHRKRAREIQKLDAQTLTELKIRFNPATLAQMWKKMLPAQADTAHGIENGVDLAALPPTAEVAKIGSQIWTIADFQARAAQTSARQQGRVQSVEDLKEFISGLALREEYWRRAQRAGFEKNSKVKQDIRGHEERFLIEKMKRLLTDSVRVPEDSLRQAYASQRQNYVYPAMVKLREIMAADQRQISHLWREAKRGRDFAELARRYSLRKWSAERGGEVGYVTKGDLGELAEEIFKLKPGEIGGPYRQQEYFFIVQVLGVNPARQKTFAEARPEIEENLLPLCRQRELQKRLQALRQPMTIAVNQQVLQQAESPLENPSRNNSDQ